jgi:GNAT superfamily N-acetyltransferase
MDWYAWWIENPETALRRLRRIAARFSPNDKITIRRGNLKDMREEARRLRQVYNQAWQKNWGFVPFTEAEFEFMRKEMQPLLVPDFIWLAEAGGEPVGFILYLPDINVALRQIDGRLTRFGLPIGLIKLLYYKSRLKTGRLVALGVVEKFRRAGIAEMLVLRIIEEAMVKRGVQGEMSMTLEDNTMINRFLGAIGGKRYKTYRIYNRSLEKVKAAA